MAVRVDNDAGVGNVAARVEYQHRGVDNDAGVEYQHRGVENDPGVEYQHINTEEWKTPALV